MIVGQTSSKRARPLNQPGSVRAHGFASSIVVKRMASPDVREVRHPFMRALRGTARAGAQYDPKEESRSLRDGSYARPNVHSALTPPA